MNDKLQQIKELQEKIHDLIEYVYSEACSACGEAIIQIDECKKRIKELESNKE